MNKQWILWGIQLVGLGLLMVSFFFQVYAAMVVAVVLLFLCSGLHFYWRKDR